MWDFLQKIRATTAEGGKESSDKDDEEDDEGENEEAFPEPAPPARFAFSVHWPSRFAVTQMCSSPMGRLGTQMVR